MRFSMYQHHNNFGIGRLWSVCIKENKIFGSYIHYVMHFRGDAGLDQFYVTLNSFF